MNDQPVKAISQEEREFYAEKGYVILPERVPPDILELLRSATDEITAQHSTYPNPADDHPAYWEFVTDSILVDVVCDLIGPDVVFSWSTLYFQSAMTSRWHQDMPYDPHTNRDVLIANVPLYDCDSETARLRLIPGSHREGYLETMRDGRPIIAETEIENIDISREIYLTAPAGSIEIMDYSMIHQDGIGARRDGNYIPMFGYAAADSFPLTHFPHNSKYTGAVVRGDRARYARFDLEPCPIPAPMDKRFRLIPPEEYKPLWTGHREVS